ncbi:MAG: efflux RND transporter periplasmic adaptor subunit [Verrucomicrobiae bacterium]|nr:efflux RND transporter periplasmic adaptor subunit [Verrucomicrobiae bacterium]
MKCFSRGLAGAILALALGAVSCSPEGRTGGGGEAGKGKGEGKVAAARPVRTVAWAVATPRPMERVVLVTGSLAALDRSTLAAKVPGRVVELPVDLGSVVRRGDLLARVDPRDYELKVRQVEAAVMQARAALGLSPTGDDEVTRVEEVTQVRVAAAIFEEAARQFARVQSLVRQNVASQAEFDKTQAEFNVASNRLMAAKEEARINQAALAQRRAELEIARQQLEDTRLLAPFDGVVEARQASLGEYLGAGAPVVTLVRTEVLRLRLEVPEREAARIQPGQPVRFRVEGSTNVHQTTLTRLSPSISEMNRMLMVEADVRGGGVLRPGAFVRAEVVVDANEPGLAVPAEALVVFAGLEKVVTVQEGKARERVVVTGRRGPDWVEILDGLKAGDPVVLRPGNLRTGDAVQTNRPAGTGGPRS